MNELLAILQVGKALLIFGLVASLIGLVPLGLLVLLIWMLIRGRKKCERCGGAFRPVWSRQEKLCGFCRAVQKSEHGAMPRWRRWLNLAFLAGLLLLLSGIPGGLLGTVLPGWAAYPLGVLAMAIFVFLLTLRQEEARRSLRVLYWLLAHRSEKAYFSAARRAAGQDGRMRRLGALIIWTDAPDGTEEEIEAATAAAAGAYAEITGQPAPAGWALRALCFQREEAFREYLGGSLVGAGRWAGCHLGRGRMIICRETSERFPSNLASVTAHEATHVFMTPFLPKAEPPWLSEGVAGAVARRVSEREFAPGAEERSFRAALARGALLPGSSLATLTRVSLAQSMRNWSDLAQADFAGVFYAQSAALVRMLCETRPDGFRAFLAKAARARDQLDCFRAALGLTAEEAVNQWIEGLKTAEVPPHAAPSETIKARIEKEMIVPVRDRSRPADDRRMAIRCLGLAGWAWGAGALIETLEDPDPFLRAEAQRALENISGELRGAQPGPWREWLESLSAGAAR